MVLMLLGGPIGLFIIAHLLFPKNMAEADLDEHLNRVAPRIWGLASLTVIVASSFRPVAFGHSLMDWDNFSSLIMLILFMTLTFSKSRKLNEILTPVIFLAVILDILIFNLAL